VTIVSNGREALEALESSAFDVVLMDVQMPEMGGIEATTQIRAREQTTGTHVRIVAMTAHAMSGDRDRCIAAGMDAYVSKPINPKALFAVVEQDQPAAPPLENKDSNPRFDPATALDRLGGDRQLFEEVVRLFLEDCPARLAAIKAAIEARDPEAIRSAAHALKGAAGNLSAQRLAEAASTLERIGTEARLDASTAVWRSVSSEAAWLLDALRQELSCAL
jgi:CheY-like chemotaxis protein